jgi:pseudouridylate synthase
VTLALSAPVRDALTAGRPVVALETSVVAQGLPDPRNLEAAEAMERAIRERGAEPAWTAVEGGAVRVGLGLDEVARLAGGAAKAGRRDLPVLVASGATGATTVSATVWIARRAGIEVVATGGTGGVHPGSGDVSADLAELGRTAVTVVCSGPKTILDPVATMERLEEGGVLVLGYRCDRVPFFVVREAAIPVEHRVESPGEAAEVIRARNRLGIEAAVLLCQPVPGDVALDPGVAEEAVRRCRREAESAGVAGKALTPRLLRCLADRTEGASLRANLALLEANAGLAADVAAALA